MGPRGPFQRPYCFSFGKYNGYTIDETPPEYVRWLVKSEAYKNYKDLTSALQSKGYLQLLNWRRPGKNDAADSRFYVEDTPNPQGLDAKRISAIDAKSYFNLRPRLLELAGIDGFELAGGRKYYLYLAYVCAQHFHTVTDGSTEQALEKFFRKNNRREGKIFEEMGFICCCPHCSNGYEDLIDQAFSTGLE